MSGSGPAPVAPAGGLPPLLAALECALADAPASAPPGLVDIR
jgi:hypothetical protein